MAAQSSSLEKNQKKPIPASGGKGTGRGGPRPNSGRKPGSPNKKTAALQAAIEASGITPLEFMLQVMRNEAAPKDADPATTMAFVNLRFEAAKAAAPYVHSKLASIEVAGPNGGPIQTASALIPVDPIEAAKAYKQMMG